ncbi:hypothetical protein BJX68DRAFT_226489 [Aspergillus pseudodeflectus]|uniref:Secreted protein n=1 Tax=Aspergillus pseudodeflectus TaxID=176178 RepID=A0ABR4L7X3_9EURO
MRCGVLWMFVRSVCWFLFLRIWLSMSIIPDHLCIRRVERDGLNESATVAIPIVVAYATVARWPTVEIRRSARDRHVRPPLTLQARGFDENAKLAQAIEAVAKRRA